MLQKNFTEVKTHLRLARNNETPLRKIGLACEPISTWIETLASFRSDAVMMEIFSRSWIATRIIIISSFVGLSIVQAMPLPFMLFPRVGAIIRLLADTTDFADHRLYHAVLVTNMSS
jgi:hypothetical protein